MIGLQKHIRRLGIDTAGYLLIIAAGLTGWLPGPGGIPLLAAGLSLLSIYNPWAKKLREYALLHGGKLMRYIFPKHPVAQWAYDTIAFSLFALSLYTGWHHDALWEVGLAASAFFAAIFISLMNRERLDSIRHTRKP